MRVTMKSLCSSPRGTMHAGRTYDLPETYARQLVAADCAVFGYRMPEPAPSPSISAPVVTTTAADEASNLETDNDRV